MWFEAISGLKVNPSKIEAIPVGEGHSYGDPRLGLGM